MVWFFGLGSALFRPRFGLVLALFWPGNVTKKRLNEFFRKFHLDLLGDDKSALTGIVLGGNS